MFWRGRKGLTWNDGKFFACIKEDSSIAMDDVSQGLKAFLDYVAGKKTEDAYVERLEEAVQEAKRNREWRHEYMTLQMRDQENQRIGKKLGEKMLAELLMLLNEDGRSSDIIKALQDEEYRQKLYKEYNIA